MGKTIQTIALLVDDRQKPNLIVAWVFEPHYIMCDLILICSPTVAVMQWKNEIETHTDDFKVQVWHGASREQNIKELQKYDVVCLFYWRELARSWPSTVQVLTTYSVLESCFRKQQSGFKRKGQIVKERSAMHAITWQRIIVRPGFLGQLLWSNSNFSLTRPTTSRREVQILRRLPLNLRASINGAFLVHRYRTV